METFSKETRTLLRSQLTQHSNWFQECRQQPGWYSPASDLNFLNIADEDQLLQFFLAQPQNAQEWLCQFIDMLQQNDPNLKNIQHSLLSYPRLTDDDSGKLYMKSREFLAGLVSFQEINAYISTLPKVATSFANGFLKPSAQTVENWKKEHPKNTWPRYMTSSPRSMHKVFEDAFGAYDQSSCGKTARTMFAYLTHESIIPPTPKTYLTMLLHDSTAELLDFVTSLSDTPVSWLQFLREQILDFTNDRSKLTQETQLFLSLLEQKLVASKILTTPTSLK